MDSSTRAAFVLQLLILSETPVSPMKHPNALHLPETRKQCSVNNGLYRIGRKTQMGIKYAEGRLMAFHFTYFPVDHYFPHPICKILCHRTIMQLLRFFLPLLLCAFCILEDVRPAAADPPDEATTSPPGPEDPEPSPGDDGDEPDPDEHMS